MHRAPTNPHCRAPSARTVSQADSIEIPAQAVRRLSRYVLPTPCLSNVVASNVSVPGSGIGLTGTLQADLAVPTGRWPAPHTYSTLNYWTLSSCRRSRRCASFEIFQEIGRPYPETGLVIQILWPPDGQRTALPLSYKWSARSDVSSQTCDPGSSKVGDVRSGGDARRAPVDGRPEVTLKATPAAPEVRSIFCR